MGLHLPAGAAGARRRSFRDARPGNEKRPRGGRVTSGGRCWDRSRVGDQRGQRFQLLVPLAIPLAQSQPAVISHFLGPSGTIPAQLQGARLMVLPLHVQVADETEKADCKCDRNADHPPVGLCSPLNACPQIF